LVFSFVHYTSPFIKPAQIAPHTTPLSHRPSHTTPLTSPFNIHTQTHTHPNPFTPPFLHHSSAHTPTFHTTPLTSPFSTHTREEVVHTQRSWHPGTSSICPLCSPALLWRACTHNSQLLQRCSSSSCRDGSRENSSSSSSSGSITRGPARR